MEAIYTSENSVDFINTTPRYIAEERTLHARRCENLIPTESQEQFPSRSVSLPSKSTRGSKVHTASIIKVQVLRQARNHHEAGGDMVHEIWVDFHQVTLPCIPRDRNFIN
jgi:hypothetical protein